MKITERLVYLVAIAGLGAGLLLTHAHNRRLAEHATPLAAAAQPSTTD